jgi:crossover junction endodeoxyribonuclease RusA
VICITIPGIPPSINEWRNMHHYEEAKQKKKWEEIVGWEVLAQKVKPQKPIERAVTTYLYFFPSRRRHDPSNYSPKWIEDGLVKAGVLLDDSFENVDLNIRKGGVDKHNPRVEIMIERLEETE